MSTISVIVEEATGPKEGTLGGAVLNRSKSRVQEISVDTIKASLSGLSEQLGEIFSDMKHVGNASLKEVQVAAEINAEGGVSLIGTAKAGVRGAITLCFVVER